MVEDGLRMLAILCSGQGRQHAGMFDLTGDAPQAAGLFAAAAKWFGQDPRRWVRSAGPNELFSNRNAQLLCTLQALGAAAALADAMPSRRCVAGYSIGELPAWGVAGLISGGDTLELAAERADVMDAARSGEQGMLYIRGLQRSAVEQLCEHRDAAVAIVNPGDAFVLAGKRVALDAIAGEAKRRPSVHVAPVCVTVASHTYLLVKASEAFRERLSRARVQPAPAQGVRLFSGIDGTTVLDVSSGLNKLALQISQSLQWSTCLRSCIEAGAEMFLELGPGGALAAMARVAHPGIRARGLDDFRSLQGARAWLRGISR
jgi:[acyl-carrier-protein] S-malonyltransferase